MQQYLRRIRRMDWWIIAAVILLLTIGVIMMYGIQSSQSSDGISAFAKQLLFSIMGISLLFGFSTINYRVFQQYAVIFYITGAILLLLVLLLGTTIRGTTGWFQIAGFSIQPVEFAKITLLIGLARYFSEHTFRFSSWKTILQAFGVLSIYSILVLLQPDLGSTAVFTFAFIGLLLLTNIKLKQLGILLSIGLIIATLSWSFVLRDYQKERISTFLDPTSEPLGAGYNVSQAII